MTTMESQHTPVDLKQFEGHTPGPWELGNENNSCAEVCIGNTETVASLCRESSYTGQMTHSREEMLANAHLIKAAPELAKEVEKLRERDLILSQNEVWWKCPHHGPHCSGEDCCCSDRHRELPMKLLDDWHKNLDLAEQNERLRSELSTLKARVVSLEEYLRQIADMDSVNGETRAELLSLAVTTAREALGWEVPNTATAALNQPSQP